MKQGKRRILKADEIRNKPLKAGIVLEDRKEGLLENTEINTKDNNSLLNYGR